MNLKRTIALLAALAALSSLCACAVNGPYDALSGLSGHTPAQEEEAPEKQSAPDVFAEPTAEPELKPTATPEPTARPTPEPSPKPTARPTAEPTPEPTAKPSPKPSAKPSPKPTVKPTAEPSPEPTVKPSPKPSAKPSRKPTVKPTAEPSPEPTVKPSPRPAFFGLTKGNEYTNEQFGLTCTLPEGWSFLSGTELDERVEGAVQEPFIEGYDDEIESFLTTEENACVAAAVSEDGLRSFNIVVQYLSGWGQYISEEDMCTIALHQLGVEEGGDLSAPGLEDGTIVQNTVSFAGEDHAGLRLTFTDRSLGIDMPVYLQFVYLIRDERAMQITMSSDFDEDGLTEVAGMFTLDKAE